ncbi:aldehyde dehydrogenase family protein [Rubripirellula reticaptiva]|uniref:Phenylacetaldehyde dehydrogenase n=1 Tax=Rubripirellula reticaptiva TaxID=2528013 RepID=A0A5C6ELE8_9BACT|nr:aldehyde dehydrogenase family protein [Rubripirellula reticaptiva]TWU48099.1 Phenylacetaldehyde dehydrogenase [Rubripirellula reticaptiva]
MSAAIEHSIPKSLHSFLASPKQLLIDGKWVDAVSGKTFDVFDPATDQVIAQAAEGDAADVDLAVAAARRAFDLGPWSKLTASDRGRLIWKIGDLIEANADELAQLETIDNGKPLGVAKAADVALAADMFRYMAGWATKIEGNTIPLNVPYAPGSQFHAFTLKEPVGVVGQIIPWNFPLLMAAWKLGPALATGCTVVLKPAEQTPLSALRLGELILEAGIPSGVVNIVTGFGETAGAAIASHPDVDKVAFTGSTEVGKLIINAATGNLKKVTLELGGKSPNVVYDDADLGMAIAGAADAIFFNQGQVCSAGSRLFVQKGIYDDVVAGISEIAKNMKVGSGFDATTQMGPLVSREQFKRVTGYLQAGIAEGAEASAGGAALDRPGYFVQPTVLKHASENMSVVREEIFGPVVAAMPFGDDSELIGKANNSSYGLAAGIWTRDISKAHRLAKSVKAGTVWINCYSIFDAALPFGGYKQSGWGREMGHAALENYLQTKSVCVKL